MDLFLCADTTSKQDAYTLLSYAVRRRWGFSCLPAITRQPQGKPFFPAHPDCHFSLSHSGSFALCVLDSRPVGADIERIRPHHPGLAQRICSAPELCWLEEQSDKASALCQLWTAKEALTKYTGTGLRVPLRKIRVPLPPSTARDDLLFHFDSGDAFHLCACGHSPVHQVLSVRFEEIKLDTIP